LDGVGLKEAAKTAEEIGGLGSVDAIYCSDLRRARQTAEALRRRTKAPVMATRDLRRGIWGYFADRESGTFCLF
jgi:broad specificity phosphatase PhoE